MLSNGMHARLTPSEERCYDWVQSSSESSTTPLLDENRGGGNPWEKYTPPCNADHSDASSWISRSSRASSARRRRTREEEVMRAERELAERAAARDAEMAKRAAMRDAEEMARIKRKVKLDQEVEDEEEQSEYSERRNNEERPFHQGRDSGRRQNLPKPEIMTFNGSASDFPRFRHNFDATFEHSGLSPEAKLGYLIQHCRGDARRCIEDCVLLRPSTGYYKAKELLQQHFGRPWLVADEFLQRLDGPPIKASDLGALKDLSIELSKCSLNIGQLSFRSQLDGVETLRRVVKRLPYAWRNQWTECAHAIMERGREATLQDLCLFVKERESVATSLFGRDLHAEKTPSREKPRSKAYERVTSLVTDAARGERNDFESPSPTPSQCLACSGRCPRLADCQRFTSMVLKERHQLISNSGCCYNCLRVGHMARRCRQPPCTVDGCGLRHHALLHRWTVSGANPSPTPEALVGAVLEAENKSRVFLGILPVTLHGSNGESVTTNALLDNGSSQSFIDAEILQRLNIAGRPVNYRINTLTHASRECTGREADVYVAGTCSPERRIRLEKVWSAASLPMPCIRAANPREMARYSHLHDLPLQEVDASPIGLLIGAGSDAITPLELRVSDVAGEPYAERTRLGWVVRGYRAAASAESSHPSNSFFLQTEELQQNLEKMWSTDFSDAMSEKAMPSREDLIALKAMEGSVRLRDDRYEISLPWKDNKVTLISNKPQAHSRLLQLKRKLSRDASLRSMYSTQMDEYLREGYAEKAPQESSDKTWYLPHHPVYSDRKPGKVRVVFDGAARFKGESLNDKLLQGPDLCNSMTGILIRYRRDPVAVTADIQAMFHQVSVPETDRDSIRFLWWPDGDLDADPSEYRMTRHVFGLRSSPSCAAFALRQTAADNKQQFSESVISSIREDFYVDDLLKSFRSAEDARIVVQGLVDVLRKGGFHLVKWSSNNKEFLGSIPRENRAAAVRDLDLTDQLPSSERTLGMLWNADADVFRFHIQIKPHSLSKRGILSVASSLFDPLGLVAPVTLEAKRLLQEISKRKATWDEEITEKEKRAWELWKTKLPALENLQIPRMYSTITSTHANLGEPRDCELHVFSDASENAYGACAYIRIRSREGASCSLVMGKSRLAPIRPITIPRLELTAAMVASKLREQVTTELGLRLQRTVMWTDSMITLGYIRNSTTRFKTFVANRLTTIHDYTQPSEWRYVPTKENPADLASRGFAADDSVAHSRWLNGPSFLTRQESEWPRETGAATQSPLPDDSEVKVVMAVDVTAGNDPLLLITRRYSCLQKATRSLAWWLRYRDCIRKKSNTPRCGSLTVVETEAAETLLLRAAQRRHFMPEIDRLSRREAVRADSRLACLDPQMQDDLLWTGSRVKHTHASQNYLILPHKDPLTDLVIGEAHASNGHTGCEQVLAETRSRFWILKGRSAVKSVLFKCTRCRRFKAPLATQQMAPALAEQLTASDPPFTFVGLDFFGPFRVKFKRGVAKRYACIFTCLSMRAVHIEITHSLSGDSFLAALSRFIARRGAPRELFSDNGTNFKAGDRELKEGIDRLNHDGVHAALRQKRISWRFNPPHASHMGGLWERLIRSARRILTMIIGQQLLNDEALLTLMAEAERILNDRPLTHVSSDPRDPEVLTPAKLLLLRSNAALPLDLYKPEDDGPTRWTDAKRHGEDSIVSPDPPLDTAVPARIS